MRKILIILCAVALFVVLFGCTGKKTDTTCSAGIMSCSDGTLVSRNPDLNCEFDTCPEINQNPVCNGGISCTINQECVGSSSSGGLCCLGYCSAKIGKNQAPDYTPTDNNSPAPIVPEGGLVEPNTPPTNNNSGELIPIDANPPAIKPPIDSPNANPSGQPTDIPTKQPANPKTDQSPSNQGDKTNTEKVLTADQKICMDSCTKQYSDPLKCSAQCNVTLDSSTQDKPPANSALCGDGKCDDFEKSSGQCPLDCKS